eukprot:699164-Amphidinium_carterae.1
MESDQSERTSKTLRAAITHVMRCDHSQRTRQALQVAITHYKSVLVPSMAKRSHTQFSMGSIIICLSANGPKAPWSGPHPH